MDSIESILPKIYFENCNDREIKIITITGKIKIVIDGEIYEEESETKSKYRTLVFQNCKNIRLLIDCKLLALEIIDSENVYVLKTHPIVGAVNFLRCKHSTFVDELHPSPMCFIEQCESCLFKSTDKTIFVVDISWDINISDKHFITNYLTNRQVINYPVSPQQTISFTI